jgi:GNAT superfamily N-acetyltransferase
MGVLIQREALTSSVAAGLIHALNAELSGLYPEPGATHFRLGEEEVSEGRGAFLVAYVDGAPLGCGAVRRLDQATAELKRMFVAPGIRGQGVGRALLRALEDEARGLGARRLVLETGIRQRAALALYRKTGFAVIPAFGEYVDSPTSVCMGKDL